MKSFYRKLCTLLISICCVVLHAGYSRAQPDMMVQHVVSVAPDTSLTQDKGEKLVLADVVFPAFDEAVQKELQHILQGKEVGVEVLGTDRYGRKVAYLYNSQGKRMTNWPHAMAYSDVRYPYTKEAVHADDAAAFRVRHDEAAQVIGNYAAVFGEVKQVSVQRNQTFVNFDTDWKTDFSIYIPRATMRQMTASELKALEGKKIVVRGFVHDYYGPRITLLNPDMLQIDASEPNRP